MRKLLAVSATTFVASAMLAVPAFAAVNNPPVLPHSIISFPQRDFVSADGYNPGEKATVNVIRNGVTIGTSTEVTAAADGLIEVNHPGGGCWVGTTPDILPGDTVQVLTGPDNGDATTTSDVIVTEPATKVGGSTVTVKGTATMADGTTPIPLDQLEVRLVANRQAFVLNGRRTLRADSTGGSDGTLAYDAPGSTSWTATFNGLNRVSTVDGLSDADRAVNAQSRGMWLGDGTGAEGTIYEFGEVAGPATPDCTAPLAQTAMTSVSQSAFNAADLAAGKTLTVGGVAQDGITGVDVALGGKNYPATPAGGTWSVTVSNADLAALPEGNSNLVATFQGAVAPPSQTRSISKDTVAPAAATATPGPGVYRNTQFVHLLKDEADATIRYTIGANPAAPTVNTGQVNNGSQIAVSASQRIKALVVDKAGNPSSVSTFAYTIDRTAPTVSRKTPTTNATGVLLGTNVRVTFSEAVTGVNSDTFKLRQGTTVIPATVTTTGRSAILNPNANLARGKKYTVVLTGGIRDIVGNRLAPVSWSFTTR